METTVSKPRNWIVLTLAAFLLGGPPVMLWLGRWKLALAYLAIYLAAVLAIFWFMAVGRFELLVVPELGAMGSLNILLWAVQLAAVLHALLLRKRPRHGAWYSRWYFALVAVPLFPLAAAFVVRTFLIQPFNIPSESNQPNLMAGDYVFVSLNAYGSGKPPRRGDMAIFKLPRDNETPYAKRVIGLPGDRIQMIGGVVHINGAAAKLEPVTLAPEFYEGGSPRYFRETLPDGRSYVIADIDAAGGADNTEVYTVPAGHYFALGDNRDNSQDSRFLNAVGFIPEQNFIGPVVFHFWNSEGFPLDNRPAETYPSE